MANSITLAQKFVPILDEVYKRESLTSDMDAATRVDFTGVNEVKVAKVEMSGLGDYSRANGYPAGDVTFTWETLKLTEERGKEISIDRMDDEETLGMAFGITVSEFVRLHVAPEIDAFRFAKYAGWTGVSTTTAADLTKDTILSALNEASRKLSENEVPEQGRRIYMSTNLRPAMSEALNRSWGNDSSISNEVTDYNGMQIVYVPPGRFYSAITLNDGSTNWGYTKATGASDLNFLMLHPSAILQAVKMAMPKIFSPDENQDKDSWKFQYRLYHDAFVYENKVNGVYVHKATVKSQG